MDQGFSCLFNSLKIKPQINLAVDSQIFPVVSWTL